MATEKVHPTPRRALALPAPLSAAGYACGHAPDQGGCLMDDVTDVPDLHTDADGDEMLEEDLVEEISIDGMCGVY